MVASRSISIVVNDWSVAGQTGADEPGPAGEGVQLLRFGGPRGISEPEVASRATGDLCVFLGAETRLRAEALERLGAALDSADLVFADETVGGVPVRKPGWSPQLLLSFNAIGRPWAIRRERVAAVGGLRSGFGAAAEIDLLLRLAETDLRAARLPEVLADSPRAFDADEDGHRRATEEACRRRGISASLVPAGRRGVLRVRPRAEEPLVTVIIPTRDRAELLRRCLAGLESGTDYPNFEILIVDNASSDPQALEDLAASPHRVVRWPGAFDYAAIHNSVAREAAGGFLLFLNNDTEVIERGWLRSMVAQASLPGVGAVGAWLLYPDGRIQHAGVVLRGHEYPHHLLRGLSDGSFRHAYFGVVPCEVSAVTGACLLIRKDLFLEMGGFDRRFRVAFNDIDLCLRLRSRGYSILIEPEARLLHRESASRVPELPPGETILFRARWDHRFPGGDPYYHPALDADRADFSERRS